MQLHTLQAVKQELTLITKLLRIQDLGMCVSWATHSLCHEVLTLIDSEPEK
jgi:hypothetical protein